MTQFNKNIVFVENSFSGPYSNYYLTDELTYSSDQSETGQEYYHQSRYTTDINVPRARYTNIQKLQTRSYTQSNQTICETKLKKETQHCTIDHQISLIANTDKKQCKIKRRKDSNLKSNQDRKKIINKNYKQCQVRKRIQRYDKITNKIKEKKKYLQNYHEKPEKNMKSYFNRLFSKKINYPGNKKQHIIDSMGYLKSFKVLDDILSSKQLINVSTPIALLPKFYATKERELNTIDR